MGTKYWENRKVRCCHIMAQFQNESVNLFIYFAMYMRFCRIDIFGWFFV